MRAIVFGITLLFAAPAVAGAPKRQATQPAAKTQSAPTAAAATHEDRGQQVFAQNCSRCHDAPQGFSSRISGTVALHMRVRAGMSDADYKALLRFLNP